MPNIEVLFIMPAGASHKTSVFGMHDVFRNISCSSHGVSDNVVGSSLLLALLQPWSLWLSLGSRLFDVAAVAASGNPSKQS